LRLLVKNVGPRQEKPGPSGSYNEASLPDVVEGTGLSSLPLGTAMQTSCCRYGTCKLADKCPPFTVFNHLALDPVCDP